MIISLSTLRRHLNSRGYEALMKWLQKNINYPPIAAENNIQGRVMIRFVVEPDGSVSNVEVVRGVGS